MQRCVEVNIDTLEGEARCAVCGGEMEPMMGWTVDVPEWVEVWWRCLHDQTHISSSLPMPRALVAAGG